LANKTTIQCTSATPTVIHIATWITCST